MKSEKNLYDAAYQKMLNLFMKHVERDFPALREIRDRLEMGVYTPTWPIGSRQQLFPPITHNPACETCSGRGRVKKHKCNHCLGYGSQFTAVEEMRLVALHTALENMGYELQEYGEGYGDKFASKYTAIKKETKDNAG